jgi:hypothetical protein
MVFDQPAKMTSSNGRMVEWSNWWEVARLESTPMSAPPSTVVMRFRYQEQDTRLTLREGLSEYYQANPGLVDPGETSTEDLGVYLQCHDVSHVFFGTTTSLRDEALQDMWTFLAIDVTKREYVGDFVKTEEGKQIMTSIPIWGGLKATVWLLGMMPSLIWRSRRMAKKWPWRGWESYLDEPLGEIREEFGLRVF